MKLLRFGSKGPYVFYLQAALKNAGYDPGKTDGIFGRRTLAALTDFQRDYGLVSDGIAGQLTDAMLYPFLAGYTVYVARSGDTIESIAAAFSTSACAIRTANPEVDFTLLTAGTELTVPFDFRVVPDDLPVTYALTEILLDGLSARYPFIRLDSAGRSVMGRRLVTATLGEGETEVFYNASHHANEWITTLLLLRYLEDYAAAYASDGTVGTRRADDLFRASTLYLMPLVNPDGVDLVTGALETNDPNYQQAEGLSTFYPDIPFPSGWKANIEGTDLNLGYPAGWEEAKRIKFEKGFTRPGPRDYVGTAPLSAVEDRAVYDFTRAHDFKLTVSYHTQGKVIYDRYLDYDPPRAGEIGRAFSEISGYRLEETPFESGFAGYKDWFIETYNRPGYTVEAGGGVSPLPLKDFMSIYRENVGILSLGMALAGDP